MTDNLAEMTRTVEAQKETKLRRMRKRYRFARDLGLSPEVSSRVSTWTESRILALVDSD